MAEPFENRLSITGLTKFTAGEQRQTDGQQPSSSNSPVSGAETAVIHSRRRPPTV
jgi:hypothetical protein